MACNIIINTDKIKLDEGVGSILSEDGFDAWLRENLGALRIQLGDAYKLSEFNPTFEIDLTERKKRVDEFLNAEKEIDTYINSSKARVRNAASLGGNTAGAVTESFITYGTTSMFGLVGKSFDEITKPVADWGDSEEAIREKGRIENWSQEKIEQEIADYKRLSALRMINGNIFGALVQDTLTKSTKDIDALRRKKNIQDDLKKYGLTFDAQVAEIKRVGQKTINKIIEEIHSLHPSIKELRTEFRVVSKFVHPNLLDALNVELPKHPDQYNPGKINHIDGRLDILIVDENGDKTSYDVKLSSYDVNDYWPTSGLISNSKYDEISAQQMAYYSMLRQWGIRLNKMRIIPAYLKYDKAGNIQGEIEYRNIRTFNDTNPYRVTCKTYFDYDEEAGAEVVKSSCEDIDELFPGLRLSDKLNTKHYTLKWFTDTYKHKINGKYRIPIDERFPLDKYRLNKGADGKLVFDDWADAEEFLDKEYIPKMNEIFAQGNINLVNGLNELSKQKIGADVKREKLISIAKDISKNNIKTQEFIVNTFKKYVFDGWQIVHDENGDFANYGILMFVKNDVIEIVMLDNNDLFQEYSLGKAGNKLILGNYVNDLQQGVDDIKYLQAYRGNLLAMQALALIARNKNGVFTGRIVQVIRTVNLGFRQELTQFNDKLRDNWNDLVYYYGQANPSKPGFKTIGTEQLMSGALALVNRADDIARLFLDRSVNFTNRENYIETRSDDSSEDILRYIRNLTAHYQINSKEDWYKHTDAFEAFTLLSQALLATRGFIVSMENDCGPYFEGLFVNGLKTLSPQESPSMNVRLLGIIESIYEQKLFEEYRKIVFPWQTAIVQALQESGYDDFFSNERNLFELCFERDDSGKITENFVLLPPHQNPDIADKPKLQQLVEIFLDTINEFRIPDELDREHLKNIPGSLYYEVPLTEATFRQQVKNSGSLMQALKTKASNIFTDTKEYLFGDTLSNWELKQYDDISKERIYNYYLDTSDEAKELRGKKLSGEEISFDDKNKHGKKFGVTAFETSLDTIFLRVMAASIRSEVSKEFMPLFTGLRAFIAFNGNITGANMNSIMDTVEEFIKSNIYHKRIIDPSDTTIYNILSVLRNITSIVGLSGSTVQFVRENITSWIRTAINATNDPLMKGIFDITDYSEFIGKIIGDASQNAKLHSFFAQVNYRYRLANITEQELPGRMKTNRFNLNNWAQDVLFLNTTMPDFTHRNAIMCAVLKKRGSFDALYQDENDELKYDPKKDHQYEIFFKYKDTKESEIPKQDLDKFKQQKARYNTARLDWNKRYGLNIQIGEYLPDALSPSEAEAVRTYADHLFGNFDSDKKALIQKTLLGSFVLQFRTFGLQQFMQNVRGKGYTNIIQTRQRTTIDGKRIFMVTSTTREELEEHGPVYFVTEDELEGLPVEKYEPVMDTAGGATYGRLPSTGEAVFDLFTDKDRFKEKISSSDIYKANLYIALIDNIGMLILAALLRLLYGEETVKTIYTQDWWTRWSYTILMGVAQDGPIDQVIGNLLGNGEPPSIGILKAFFSNAQEVITGEKPVLYGLFNTFGATKQLTGMVLGQD